VSHQGNQDENGEPAADRDGVTEEKRLARAQRPWWKMKRWWVAAPIVLFVAASSLESLLLYFLQRPVLASHANFEERYENYEPDSTRKFQLSQKEPTSLGFGYTVHTYFVAWNGGQSIDYVYRPPKKYFSILRNWFVQTGKADKMIAYVRQGKVLFVEKTVKE